MALDPTGPVATRNRAREAARSQDPSELSFLIETIRRPPEQDEGPDVAKVAAFALATYPDELTRPHLAKLIGDPIDSIRVNAAYALAKAPPSENNLEALKYLATDHCDEVVLWTALGLSKQPGAASFMAGQIVRLNGDLPRAGYFADSLSRLASPVAQAELSSALSALSPTRRANIEALLTSLAKETL